MVWDNATEFERKFQSWWHLVTFDPNSNTVTAFVLTIALVYNIHPTVALGLNHHRTVLYPLEHKVWARKNGDVEACVT